MPKFTYKVRDLEDRVMTGTMDGATVDEVIDRLADREFMPIEVEELNFDGTRKNETFSEKLSVGIKKSRNKVPYKAVVFFTRQLATMVAEGVPLAKALEQLARGEKPVFQKIIQTVAEDISTGYTFSDAVAKHPGAFSPMFVSACRSGEITGALDQVLSELATYMENIEIMRGKVKSAMRYPIFIAGFVVLLMIGILWKLVPTFEGIYKSLNANLPAPTLLLIKISQIIRSYFPLLILLAIGAFFLFKFLMTKDGFRYQVHRYILDIPVFGLILKKNIWATFCRTMALLMESGTPILKAAEIAGAVVGNKVYSQSLENVYESLRQGEMLSASLEKTGRYPVLIIQLVSTGETSGKVDDLLRKAAEFYEREIRNTVDSLASIIEPVLIIILGALVGGILLSLYLPIFMIGQFIK